MKIITTGIASTTHIDRHGERYAKSALDSMASQIKERFIPHLIEHDPKKHIGTILYGEVFKLNDSEYALGVVTGIFENDEERRLYETGKPNTMWDEGKKYSDIGALLKMHDNNRDKGHAKVAKRPSERTVADLLETHLDSTQVLPDGRVYKIKRYIASTGDLRIEVYPKDHEHQPHFHVISKQRGINARFDLATLELINVKRGKIKQGDAKKIQSFFEQRPNKLEELRKEHQRLS